MNQRTANIISIIGHPFLTLPLFVIFILFKFEEPQKAFATSGIIIGGMFIPLAIKSYLGTKKGQYTNYDVSNQKQRQRWYVTAIFLLVLVVVALFLTDQSRSIRLNTVYAFLLLLTAQLLNFYIKSSMHTAFNVFLIFLILPISTVAAIIFTGFVFLIAWSRLVLKRHSLKEVIFGAVIGLIFGLSSYITLLPSKNIPTTKKRFEFTKISLTSFQFYIDSVSNTLLINKVIECDSAGNLKIVIRNEKSTRLEYFKAELPISYDSVFANINFQNLDSNSFSYTKSIAYCSYPLCLAIENINHETRYFKIYVEKNNSEIQKIVKAFNSSITTVAKTLSDQIDLNSISTYIQTQFIDTSKLPQQQTIKFLPTKVKRYKL